MASIMLAMRKLPAPHSPDAHRKSIDTMRITLGMRLKTQWTEERWVREVPLVWRIFVCAGIARKTGRLLSMKQLTQDEASADGLLDPFLVSPHLLPRLFCPSSQCPSW